MGEAGALGGEADEVALEGLLGDGADLLGGALAEEAEGLGHEVEVAAVVAGGVVVAVELGGLGEDGVSVEAGDGEGAGVAAAAFAVRV